MRSLPPYSVQNYLQNQDRVIARLSCYSTAENLDNVRRRVNSRNQVICLGAILIMCDTTINDTYNMCEIAITYQMSPGRHYANN